MSHRTVLLRATVAVAFAATLSAQAPPPAASPTGGAPPVARSPEVHADRTVTFRLRAPEATAARTGRRSAAGQGVAADDEGRGRHLVSVTIGPLPPEISIYNFRVQGVDLPDPSNISLMPRAAGAANASSFVEVPGDGPAF